MRKITVKINRRNLTGLVNKTSFKYSGGMFTSYGFIAIEFKTDRNNTAKFYESCIVSRNSLVNYPGFKIWDNGQEDWKKSEVLESCEDYLVNERFSEIESNHP